MNPLNISNMKQAPKIIMDFSKYKKKGDFKNNVNVNITNDKAYLNKIKNNNKIIENTQSNNITCNNTKKNKPIYKKINTQINKNK